MSDWSKYDDFLTEADADNRVGDHDFMIGEVVVDEWPSGDPRIKIKGVLLTANSAKADLTLSPPPPADVLAAEKDSWEPGKKKAIASAIRMYRVLEESYGVDPMGLTQGTVLAVKTAKTKREEDGSGGFIRIIVIHPKERVGKKAAETGAAVAKTPF